MSTIATVDCGHDDYVGACKSLDCNRCAPRITAIARVLTNGIKAAVLLQASR